MTRSNPYKEHFAEVKKRNGNRLSKQNYCTHCVHRHKHLTLGKVLCTHQGKATPINDAMKTCELLVPFDKYKEVKQNTSSTS